jgi:nucleoid-associated protein YgaU
VLGRYGEMVNDKDPRDKAGNPRYVTKADFNFGYQPIDGNYPAAAPGVYTVGAGDALQSIARSAYGDAGLWYRITDANGLSFRF